LDNLFLTKQMIHAFLNDTSNITAVQRNTFN
jgi:hypothetical protein